MDVSQALVVIGAVYWLLMGSKAIQYRSLGVQLMLAVGLISMLFGFRGVYRDSHLSPTLTFFGIVGSTLGCAALCLLCSVELWEEADSAPEIDTVNPAQGIGSLPPEEITAPMRVTAHGTKSHQP
jgi:hypothetical protein